VIGGVMVERHTCFYKVNDTPLYRSIIEAKNFDDEMKNIGVFKRTITELVDEEFEGVFEIDPENHPNKGFDYFKSRGILFSMTRPSIVQKIEKCKKIKKAIEILEA
tara:strand:+ start:18 stop:335 length:318 start_codon:yes stop_codon:yes gene_type:complete